MKSPRICIFTETYYPITGGGETQSRSLANHLKDQGYSVILLTRRSHIDLKKMEHIDGVPVYRISPIGSGQFKKWGLLITAIPALFRRRDNYDLIYVSGFRRIGMPAVLLSKLLNKVCILKSDSLGEMSGDYFSSGLSKLGLKSTSPLFDLFLAARNSILKNADAFVAISSVIEDELLAEGIPASSITRIPNSVDLDKFKPVEDHKKAVLRNQLSIPTDAKVIIYTGRLVSYKGLPQLLEVWRILQEQQTDLQLLLVGTGGDDIHNCEKQLRQYVQQNELGSSVRFTGSVENVNEYLQASDIFVFPTTNEAFGISAIEAMACGLPVITSDVGGLKDIVVHGQNGLLVQPENKEELFQALKRLISDQAYAERLGISALQTVRDCYSVEMVIGKYINLFHQSFR